MKRCIPFLFILLFGSTLCAQNRVLISKDLRDKAVTRHHKMHTTDVNYYEKHQTPCVTESTMDIEESIIGNTWYDLQSNSLLGNRIHFFNDGTIGAVWTRGVDNPPSFPDRGTGYNYYDGTAWGPAPATQIESIRTGWPSYDAYGEDGEIVSSHDFTNGKILLLDRTTKGTGTWNEWPVVEGPVGHNISWARMSTAGVNHSSVHLLYTTWPVANGGTLYNGMDGALLYSKTSDGGTTWDYQNVQLDGTTISEYNSLSADEYVWAEPRAGTIAFVCADAWHDMFIMKSTDDGDNWEKTVVWEHPYPFFDWNTTITSDTIWCPDNSADIAIDNDGKVHLVCGISRVAHFEVGTTYSYWPWTDGIAYWNEDRPPFEAPNQHKALSTVETLVEDYDLIGWTQDVDGNGTIDFLDELMSYRQLGISTMPDITINEFDHIFVGYASTTEGYDNSTYNFKHIWITNLDEGGWGNWPKFLDVNTDLIHIFDECIYPVLAGKTENSSNHISLHLIYNADSEPGTALDEDHPYGENSIYHAKILYDIYTSIDEYTSSIANVTQNYPNPFSDVTYIKVQTAKKTELKLEVCKLEGREVVKINKGKVGIGTHTFTVTSDNLTPGIYVYRIIADDKLVTGKMVVE